MADVRMKMKLALQRQEVSDLWVCCEVSAVDIDGLAGLTVVDPRSWASARRNPFNPSKAGLSIRALVC